MTGAILSINAGSSSIKFGLFEPGEEALERVADGKLERIGIAPRLAIHDRSGEVVATREWPGGAQLTHEALLEDLFGWAQEHLPHRPIAAVSHRVVHGGTGFTAPVLVDEAILQQLEGLCAIAPLHQPHNLAAIRAIARLAPGLPQVA